MSDLLNQASLVMVPSGYKEDTVYSVVPSDGSGDLSFTRASNGTRVNSAGLVEVTPWNLVSYSNTFSDSSWVKSSCTLTSGQNDPNGGTNGWRYLSSVASTGYAYQNGVLQNGVQYTFYIYAKSNTGSNQTMYFTANSGSFTSPAFTLTSSWQLCSWTFTANSTGDNILFGYNPSATLDLLVYGAQLNIGATAKPYFPTTDRLNVPRLTYQNGGGGCPSLLLEKQSTNVVTYSEQFDNGAWVKSGSNSVTANAIISPDGTQNADFVVSTATNSSPKYVYQVISLIATPTATIYAKAGAVTEMMFYCQGGNGIYFNLTNGAFIAYYGSGSSTITTYSSVAVGNGWYRYSITFNTSVTSIEAYMSVNTNISASIANGDGFYLYGAQLEASSYATSYIPTTSSSATRVADSAVKTGISSLIGQTEGTFFVDINITKLTDNEAIGTINSGGYTNNTTFQRIGNTIQFVRNSATQSGASVETQTISIGRHKMAIAYKSGDTAFYLNGSQVSTTQTQTFTNGTLSVLRVGTDAIGALPITESFNEVVIFPTRLTNAELAQLTA